MKKSKKQRVEAVEVVQAAPSRSFVWWPWAAAAAALFVLFEAYGPALDGPFVLDDRYLPFFNPTLENSPLFVWATGLRPLLMLTFWLDHQRAGAETHAYHVTNLLMHFGGGVLMALVVNRLLEYVNTEGRVRAALSVFAGGLFLLHPLQTESVAYVASRSETLSVGLYYAALCVFLYKRPGESISLWRALAVLVLFGAAVSSKEHTLTLPVLLVLLDLAWVREGWRKNALLYGIMAVAGIAGGLFVAKSLSGPSAGFSVKGLTPFTYFFTQCRVFWSYIRLFILPYGQNLDPEVAVAKGVAEPGVILGLLGLIGLAAAAWIYRKRFPVAALGVAVLLLLLAPTSSIVPIADVMAERRVYLPFLGLALIVVEFLRRLKFSQIVTVGAVILAVCTVLTYQRAEAWGSSLALWQDTVAKSPHKVRPRFQLAYAQYEVQHCPEAAQQYEIAAGLAPPDYTLLTDWALALDCAGRANEALEKLDQAAALEHNAHAYALKGMVYGKQGKKDLALTALAEAERINPAFAMTYVYRGNVFEVSGDAARAAEEYRHALLIEPGNEPARTGLGRLGGRR
jgi:protein O-mannosyl-transferase